MKIHSLGKHTTSFIFITQGDRFNIDYAVQQCSTHTVSNGSENSIFLSANIDGQVPNVPYDRVKEIAGDIVSCQMRHIIIYKTGLVCRLSIHDAGLAMTIRMHTLRLANAN